MNLFKLSDETYDALNRIAKYGIPSIATFYFSIAQILGLPYAEQVLAVSAALGTLLGVWLAISKKNFEPETDGDLVWNDDEVAFELHLNDLPEKVTGKHRAVLNVKTENTYPQ